MNGMNTMFIANPANLLEGVCVDNATMQRGPDGAEHLKLLNQAKVGSFDLVITGGNSARLAFAGAGYNIVEDAPIKAYWCPFLQGEGLPGWVDVPRNNPQYSLVLTAAMQGCAFVITNSPDSANSFRVFHNQHPDNPKTWTAIQNSGANQEISRFEYAQYGNAIPGAGGGLTNAFNLLFRSPGGNWSYVSQSNLFVPLPMGFNIKRDETKPILNEPTHV